MNHTTKRFARSIAEAFPRDANYAASISRKYRRWQLIDTLLIAAAAAMFFLAIFIAPRILP